MRDLGKVVFLLPFILLSNMYASVVASVDSKIISLGETVTLNLVVTGEDIQKPNLYKICGSDISATSSQTSIQTVNMNYQKRYTLSYKFTPEKSCTIEPIELTVDAQVQRTKPIGIVVKAYSKKDADFSLIFLSDKHNVYVGEPFELTLLLKQKNSVQALDSKFTPPEFDGFWVKSASKPKKNNDGTFTTTTLKYKMAPQHVGILPIHKTKIQIATRSSSRDVWGSFISNVKWHTYFSNDLNMTVKALPNSISLVGDFKIDAKVDKTAINHNEAVNVTIRLNGDGNLEDVKSFKPFIDGVNVFDEKIKLSKKVLTQNIAFVSDRDFEIPAFSLQYFNIKTKKIETITTNSIKIRVNGVQEKKELNIQRSKEVTPPPVTEVVKDGISSLYAFVIFLIGLFVGILLMLLKSKRSFQKEKKLSQKDPKVLFVKLMPYKDDKNVQILLDSIETNIYSDLEVKIDKKLLKECVKKYL